MHRNGLFIAHTGGGGNHAPFEIQSDDNLGRDTDEEYERALSRQLRVAQEFADITGASSTGAGTSVGTPAGHVHIGDDVFMWLVKRDLFLGRANAISVMKYLRMNSTVEYCNVLGANVYQQKDRKDPPFGVTELLLVSTYLGGPPL
jgi:hypothetical protein